MLRWGSDSSCAIPQLRLVDGCVGARAAGAAAERNLDRARRLELVVVELRVVLLVEPALVRRRCHRRVGGRGELRQCPAAVGGGARARARWCPPPQANPVNHPTTTTRAPLRALSLTSRATTFTAVHPAQLFIPAACTVTGGRGGAGVGDEQLCWRKKRRAEMERVEIERSEMERAARDERRGHPGYCSQ
ncbi:hypothetical protein T492DRAFT_31931 [Pavlovales sp. CCMP2436]|nr:hypothetical protein T492DRAFT_31931 [Pavlovales sp. CCMP2436]